MRALVLPLCLCLAGCSSGSPDANGGGGRSAAGSGGQGGQGMGGAAGMGGGSREFPTIPEVLTTPESRFSDLPGYDFAPNYVELGNVRMHYLDEGPPDGIPVVMLHGEPSWAFLYRTMVPVITAAGHRALVPDLIGFGRSDKPSREADHSYARHVDWVVGFLEALDVEDAVFVLQDWGGLIGLRIAAEEPNRVRLMVLSNTFLPTGEEPGAGSIPAFVRMLVESGPISSVLQGGTVGDLSQGVLDAYDAPYPDETFKAGPLALPLLVPASADDPAHEANVAAWEVLRAWTKPVVTASSDGDPFLGPLDQVFQSEIPGAEGQPHTTIRDAGHFVQEDDGEELARVTVDFIGANPP